MLLCGIHQYMLLKSKKKKLLFQRNAIAFLTSQNKNLFFPLQRHCVPIVKIALALFWYRPPTFFTIQTIPDGCFFCWMVSITAFNVGLLNFVKNICLQHAFFTAVQHCNTCCSHKLELFWICLMMT